jgi:hypothetical protein
MRFLAVVPTAVVTFAVLGMGSLLAQQAPAQQKAPKAPIISQVEYKPLTLWRQVTIGGAYYTDPGYVKNLSYAYGFPISSVSEASQPRVRQLLRDGLASVAMVNAKTGNAKTLGNDTRVFEAGAAAPSDGLFIMTAEDSLLGQSPSTVWVADAKAH